MIFGSKNRMVKHYVEVVAFCHRDKSVTPIQIVWDDHRVFDVTVVGEVHREVCLTGEYALKHTIMVGRHKRVLWHGQHGWFVEVPEHLEESWGAGRKPGIADPRSFDIPC